MKNIQKYRLALVSSVSAAIATVIALTVFADVPQPVLSIQSLGTNQFSITITNGGSTNYTLFWTPILADPSYPWQVLGVGDTGQTNFTVDGGEIQTGFFRVLVGADSDGDGVPDWMDAQSFNPAVGVLDVIISYPTNNTVFN